MAHAMVKKNFVLDQLMDRSIRFINVIISLNDIKIIFIIDRFLRYSIHTWIFFNRIMLEN